MINILLIGVGKLGSRHLQALSQVQIPNTNIYVVDTSLAAIETAKERYAQMPVNSAITSVNYLSSIDDLKEKEVNLAIVATTSEYRKDIINNLCKNFRIQYLLLEKFLFQDEHSFHQIKNVLQEANIKTWVNCPRRQWDFYNDLKLQLVDKELLQVDITGSHWSLATSAIHFIDLIAFLIDIKSYEILDLDFGNTYVPAYSAITGARESKYIEFYGSMKGKFKGSAYFNFTCLKSEMPFSITFITNKGVINIFEELGKSVFNIYGPNRQINISEQSFVMPYQSHLTNLIAEDIILNGVSRLTTFEEAVQLHLPLLNSYLNFLSSLKNERIIVCPIT